jgi:hypothetical protein
MVLIAVFCFIASGCMAQIVWLKREKTRFAKWRNGFSRCGGEIR